MDIEEKLVEVVERVINSADFVAGELPGYVQELLVWKAVDYSVAAFVFGALTAVAVSACRYCLKKHAERPHEEWGVFGAPLSVLFGAIFGASTLYYGMQVLKIWIAPKVYLVEYAASLLS